jgi:hypothetical protein
MAYDEKLRRRVIQYKDTGHTFGQTQEAFGRGVIMLGTRNSKKPGSLRIIIPKTAKGK